MLAPSEQYKAGVKPIENSNRIASIALALALVAFVCVCVFLCVCVKSVTNEASGIFVFIGYKSSGNAEKLSRKEMLQ